MTVTGLETLGHAEVDELPAVDGKKVHGRSPMRIVLDRLRADKVAMVSVAVIFVLVALGLLAPVISSLLNICPDEQCTDTSAMIEYGYPVVGPPYYPFTWAHPFGLEPNTGYDNLARLLYGLRTSIAVATVATVLSTMIGVAIGLVAGFAHGWLDRIISFTIDTFLSFPFILGALALAPIITSRFATNPTALTYASVISLISVLVIFGWMGLARLIRGEVLSLREREFVQSAQVIGVPTRRILFKELLPNLVAPIVVAFSLSLPAYVAAEAGLAFLGIGITGVPTLGRTIAVAYPYYDQYPLYLWGPVVTIMILVVALNLLGDSVRDAFDPQTRR